MIVTTTTQNWDEQDVQSVVFIYENVNQLKSYVANSPAQDLLAYLMKSKQIDDTKKSVVSAPLLVNKTWKELVFVGVETPVHERTHKESAARLARHLQKKCITSTVIHLTHSVSARKQAQQIVDCMEGMVLGSYQYQRYKSKPKKTDYLTHVTLFATSSKTIQAALNQGLQQAQAQNIARDLANTPANFLTPKDVVGFVKQHFAQRKQVDVCVYNQAALKKMKMGALLAVAQGSVEEPFLLEITLNASKKPPVILVGKGVTFDTGGISIKPSRSMADMKGDMGGAAAVIGALSALDQLNVKQHVKVLVPLVENMPSANAYKPGDVIVARNGTTIEVINTDAEGRLILADALCWATTFKPKAIIDIATLTGACSVALGDVATAVMGSDRKLLNSCLATQKTSGERLWELPIYDDYKTYLASDVADIKNCAENRLAGTGSAAYFLQQFVGKCPWLHLDIASTMNYSSAKGCRAKGMDGSGVRTLIQVVQAL
ncbi:leucyl aminopeptidase [bacterium]|nr:leucyl aminopeptidase [bacterium]